MKKKLSAQEIKKLQAYYTEPECFEEAVEFGEWVVGKYGDMTNCNNHTKIYYFTIQSESREDFIRHFQNKTWYNAITFIPAYEYAKSLTQSQPPTL